MTAPPTRDDDDEGVVGIDVVRRRGDARASDVDALACEEPLEIQVHGRPVAVVMRTPGHDEDLALGFLVTEGVVARADHVAQVRHCSTVPDPEAEDNVVQVTLAPGVDVDFERLRRNTYASSSCGVCGKASLQNVLVRAAVIDAEAPIAARTLYAMPKRLREAQAAFSSTGGLHAAGLFDLAGAPLVVREDVGRHNAVDKVVGAALARGVAPSSTALLVSGRVSFEVVQKAAVAGIPVVAGISAPTSLAVRLSREAGITLVGFLRGETMNVYAHDGRVR